MEALIGHVLGEYRKAKPKIGSLQETTQVASQPDPILTTITQAVPRGQSALTTFPVEILIAIMCGLDFVSAVCFGITCAATYKALKIKYTEPIDLIALRAHVNHARFCYVGLSNNWGWSCRCSGDPLSRPISSTLAHFIILPTTFASVQLATNSSDYRMSYDRGDCRWTFLNKNLYGERAQHSDKVGLEKIMEDRYKIYAHFRRFGSYVTKGSTVRLPHKGDDMALRYRTSLLPSPFGLSFENWTKEVVDAIIEDAKNWGSSREGWMGFWKEHLRNFKESDIVGENKEALVKAGDEYDWPVEEIDENQAAITACMVQRELGIWEGEDSTD
ncbi:hypothetical protein BDZ45DRAFT_776432 [Acephala macrosclerotiorum]|nr:hypothetical protein BDZ45DRAFT_776432 [Acephala macrosclerotiorum]